MNCNRCGKQFERKNEVNICKECVEDLKVVKVPEIYDHAPPIKQPKKKGKK